MGDTIAPAHGDGGTTGVLPARRRFTVDEYYRMAAAGILHEDDRVELLEGEIVQMAPIGSRHAGCVITLDGWFNGLLGGRALVSVQNPVRLSQHLEPQPDLMLLRPRVDNYRRGHPTAEDVLLLIEVADATPAYDRGTKLPLYARAGITEVWIVDLDRERVEVYREPVGGRYQRGTVHERRSVIAPAAFPDIAITCDQILG